MGLPSYRCSTPRKFRDVLLRQREAMIIHLLPHQGSLSTSGPASPAERGWAHSLQVDRMPTRLAASKPTFHGKKVLTTRVYHLTIGSTCPEEQSESTRAVRDKSLRRDLEVFKLGALADLGNEPIGTLAASSPRLSALVVGIAIEHRRWGIALA